MYMVRYNLYLSKDQAEELKELSNNGVSVSEHIRAAINTYLELHRIKAIVSASKKGK